MVTEKRVREMVREMIIEELHKFLKAEYLLQDSAQPQPQPQQITPVEEAMIRRTARGNYAILIQRVQGRKRAQRS